MLLKKMKDEMAKRNFSSVTSEKLLALIINCENTLGKVADAQIIGGGSIYNFNTEKPSFYFDPED